MRIELLLSSCLLLGGCLHAPVSDSGGTAPRLVEAACGQCQFGLPGDGCDLAVRFDGQAYFVDGTGIDDHGDAHAADGLCNAVRMAKVTGHVENGRFQAHSLELQPEQ